MNQKRSFSALLGMGGLLLLVFALTFASCDFFGFGKDSEKDKKKSNTSNPGTEETNKPVAGDFDFGNLDQTVWEVTAVTITPKADKSKGQITIKYKGGAVIPQAAGSYAVTFDVAATKDWEAATGLSAGTLTVKAGGPSGGPYSNDYTSENFNPALCSFYDKFNGTSLNTSKWAYQNGNGQAYGNWGWGNSENQGYDPSGVIVGNGILRLEVRNQGNSGRAYTSGKIVTANARPADDPGTPKGTKFAQTYGRFEAKIRMSKMIPGAWPAWWMMPVASAYGGWPRSGEIDIMEMVGREPGRASATIHFQAKYGNWEGRQYRGSEHWFDNDSVANVTQWHIYSVVWKPNEIIFLVDGKQFRRLTGTGDWASGNAFYQNSNSPYDRDFHLILNFATDGTFDSGRINPAQLPISMEVDWVRCYTTANDPWTIPGSIPANRITNHAG